MVRVATPAAGTVHDSQVTARAALSQGVIIEGARKERS